MPEYLLLISSFFSSKACDKAASSDSYKDLVDSVGKEHPNTKIIPYPFNVAKEDETLVLIDEVLNAFGRLGM